MTNLHTRRANRVMMSAMVLLQIGSGCQGDPVSVSRGIGATAALLSIGIPIGIWLIAMRPWKPKTRISYATRFALLPSLLFSTQLGGPIARQMAGHESSYLMGFGQTLGAVVLLSLVAAPFAFGVGYLIARARFPAMVPDSMNESKLHSAPTALSGPEAGGDSPEQLHQEIRRRRWQIPSVGSTDRQAAKADGGLSGPGGATKADAHIGAPSGSSRARMLLASLVLIVVVVLGARLAGNFVGKQAGMQVARADLDRREVTRQLSTTTPLLSQARNTNFPFLEAARPPTYPVSRAWWSEDDGCGALFPEAPTRLVVANSVKAVGYQGPIDLGLDGTAVANVTVQALDHGAAAAVGDAAFLGMCHDAFVASIGAHSVHSKRQAGTHACGGAMLSYSVDWDGPDGSGLTSAGFWVVNAGKVYRAGVMFHRDIGAESERIVRHFPTTLALVKGNDYRRLTEEPRASTELGDSRAASGTSNFVEVRLGGGVSFEVPKNWVVLSGNQRVTLDSSVESLLDLSGSSNPASELPFAANLLSDGGATTAMFNVRFYPRMSMSQADVSALTPEDISQVDQLGKEETMKSLQMQKLELLSWEGTQLQVVGGQKAFVVEYQRKAQTANDKFVVRLVRFFRGDRSFTVTVSYRSSFAKLLRPIADRIILSIKCM